MIRALTTAATGLEAQQTKIGNIANDLANANTDGYKRTETEFHDLMYETIKEPGASLGASSQTPVGIQHGMGVRVGASHKNFEVGPTKMTYNPYDFMIEGPGFFRVTTPAGQPAYTRNGAFHIDAQGILQLSNGSQLTPQITIPANALNITVAQNGEVRATLPDAGIAVIGQLEIANFQNPQGLSAQGDGLFLQTQASGPAIPGLPGENGMGFLMQGALEGSNVNVANSMVDMITTQRTYEMGTRVMNVADKMLEATVNVK